MHSLQPHLCVSSKTLKMLAAMAVKKRQEESDGRLLGSASGPLFLTARLTFLGLNQGPLPEVEIVHFICNASIPQT
jgi:hypothetical protein